MSRLKYFILNLSSTDTCCKSFNKYMLYFCYNKKYNAVAVDKY